MGTDQRAEMQEAALLSTPRFKAYCSEITHPKPTYNYLLLAQLQPCSWKANLEKSTNFPCPEENSCKPTGKVLVSSWLLLFVFKKKNQREGSLLFHT